MLQTVLILEVGPKWMCKIYPYVDETVVKESKEVWPIYTMPRKWAMIMWSVGNIPSTKKILIIIIFVVNQYMCYTKENLTFLQVCSVFWFGTRLSCYSMQSCCKAIEFFSSWHLTQFGDWNCLDHPHWQWWPLPEDRIHQYIFVGCSRSHGSFGYHTACYLLGSIIWIW